MNKKRADEIIRHTFYRHIDNLTGALTKKCNNTDVAFYVGRYVGMMQKELENELEKEVDENEQSV